MSRTRHELDSRYEVRMAVETDAEAIVTFIEQHWRKDHAFVKSRTLLDWQHFDPETRRYNFILGVQRATGQIHGLLGIIPLSQFDPGIGFERLVWMAIWKVRDDARGVRLGRHLMSHLEDVLQPEIVSTVAASGMTLPMYQARGFLGGRLSHYFLLNPAVAEFKLAANVGPAHRRSPASRSGPIRRLVPAFEDDLRACAEVFSSQEAVPRKTPEYLVRRYLRHPFYRYQAWAILEATEPLGLLVTRICSHEDAHAIRIVDFVGRSSALRGLGVEWVRLMTEHKAEYVDFCNSGISHEDLAASGFLRRDPAGDLVIPNYFEPFVRENIEIGYVIRLKKGLPYRVVKGDSDQDRPNLL